MEGNLAMNSHFENMSEKDGNDMADHYLTDEGNKLIADFMPDMKFKDYGANYESKGLTYRFLWHRSSDGSFDTFSAYLPDDLLYHKSWDWLMPVVEKISNIKLPEALNDFDTHHPTTFGMLNAETGRPMFRFYCYGVFEADTLIYAAWMACVDFIKLYKP